MEKEILNQILLQIKDFKKDQIFYLIIAFFIFLIISIFQTIYTARLIDKYRSSLKKGEIKFSKFNDLQISKLSDLFELAKDLKFVTATLKVFLNANPTKIGYEDWNIKYENFNSYYHANKYIIPKSMKIFVSESLQQLSDFKYNLLLYSKILEKELTDNYTPKELEEFEAIVDKEIEGYHFEKECLKVILFCEQLKDMIEEYFEKLE